MNIKRFTAPTSREALAKARMAFGEGTLILSNRPTANGVEVVATAEDTLSALDNAAQNAGGPTGSMGSQGKSLQGGRDFQDSRSALHEPLLAPKSAARAPVRPMQIAATANRHNPVEEDTEQLAMSTLSFQDYVRERMLRRRHEVMNGPAEPPTFAERSRDQDRDFPRERPAAPAVVRHNPLRSIPMDLPEPPPRRKAEAAAPAASMAQQQSLMNELQAMKEMIEDRFNTMAWLGQAKQNPIQSNLMLKMIRAGYSPALARAVLERMPEDLSAGDAVRWLMDVLERNLKTDENEAPLYEQGGIFALVGSTGVGKTTTTAKLAALCARVHGPGSVGLITLDTYRVGGPRTTAHLRPHAGHRGAPGPRPCRTARPAGPAQWQENGADRHHWRRAARSPQAQHAGRAGPAPREPAAGAQCRLPRRHAGRCAHLFQDRWLAAGHPVQGGRSREAGALD